MHLAISKDVTRFDPYARSNAGALSISLKWCCVSRLTRSKRVMMIFIRLRETLFDTSLEDEANSTTSVCTRLDKASMATMPSGERRGSTLMSSVASADMDMDKETKEVSFKSNDRSDTFKALRRPFRARDELLLGAKSTPATDGAMEWIASAIRRLGCGFESHEVLSANSGW